MNKNILWTIYAIICIALITGSLGWRSARATIEKDDINIYTRSCQDTVNNLITQCELTPISAEEFQGHLQDYRSFVMFLYKKQAITATGADQLLTQNSIRPPAYQISVKTDPKTKLPILSWPAEDEAEAAAAKRLTE